VQAPAEAIATWLSQLITRKVAPSHAPDALQRELDIKVLVAFGGASLGP
jgi:hypothetical protein